MNVFFALKNLNIIFLFLMLGLNFLRLLEHYAAAVRLNSLDIEKPQELLNTGLKVCKIS